MLCWSVLNKQNISFLLYLPFCYSANSRYGDFQEARTREITLDITQEAFQLMTRTACHMEPKLSPETAVHTLQAAKMYMISKLQEYCLTYLLAQTDCAGMLRVLTAAAKLSYQLEPEVLQKYWATILVKSSEVVASSAFLETHGSIIAQILKLDEFEVDEDTLWSRLLEWSANAVRHPKLLGPYADATGETVKRSKTAADDTGLGTHETKQQKGILKLMSENIRLGAMSKEFFLDNVRRYLTHERNYAVMEYFMVGRKAEQVWATKRSGLPHKDEVTPYTLTESREIQHPLARVSAVSVSCPWTPSPTSVELTISLRHARHVRRLELSFSPRGQIWSVGLKKPDPFPTLSFGLRLGGPWSNGEISFKSTTVGRQVICTMDKMPPFSTLYLTCKNLVPNPAALTKITAP